MAFEQIYTSAKTVSLASGAGPLVYIQSWDAFILVNGVNNSELDKIFRDGSQFKIGYPGTGIPGMTIGSRVGGKHWFASSVWGTPLYAADEITGQPDFATIFNPSWALPAGYGGGGGYVDDQAGLWVHQGVPSIGIYRLSDGTSLGSISLGWIPDSLHYAGLDQVLAVQRSGGKVALVNYVTRTIIWNRTVPAFALCAYDALHNLIVTIGVDGLVRVYLASPMPAALSAPVFSPATVRCLQGHQVSVQLTGDQGEPCEGYVVHWSLQNGIGYLAENQSETDDNGNAANYYFGPRAGGGPETVKAQVNL